MHAYLMDEMCLRMMRLMVQKLKEYVSASVHLLHPTDFILHLPVFWLRGHQ